MNGFILLHRRLKDNGETVPTWVNVHNINTISETADGNGSRITMRDGFLVVSDDVHTVLDMIWRASRDR